MIKKIRLEIILFSAILVMLAFVKHQDLLDTPLSRFEDMQAMGNFLHPFMWTFIIYAIIWIFRLFVKGILKLKNRNR